MPDKKELEQFITKAQELHGHLGPFLIIGVRMGLIAKKQLCKSNSQNTSLVAKVKLPLSTPFSCLLDGIQITTTCTIGNQRLKIENALSIEACFMNKKSGGEVLITLNQDLTNEMQKRLKEQDLTEDYALKLARAPDKALFNIKMD